MISERNPSGNIVVVLVARRPRRQLAAAHRRTSRTGGRAQAHHTAHTAAAKIRTVGIEHHVLCYHNECIDTTCNTAWRHRVFPQQALLHILLYISLLRLIFSKERQQIRHDLPVPISIGGGGSNRNIRLLVNPLFSSSVNESDPIIPSGTFLDYVKAIRPTTCIQAIGALVVGYFAVISSSSTNTSPSTTTKQSSTTRCVNISIFFLRRGNGNERCG